METFGSKLKELRTRWNLSLKEVEEQSAKLAERWGRPSYRISASWLYRVESEDRELSAAKLIVLASIYNLGPDELLALGPDPVASPTAVQPAVTPNASNLLPSGPLEKQARQWVPDELVQAELQEKTALLPFDRGFLPTHYRRAVVGLEDRYLFPMVLAGSYLLVDTTKRLIASRRDWNNEFDRPIYFLLTRNGYFSGFCELDRSGEWLTLVPHPLSYASTRRWRYKKEVEVVGTVTAFSMKRVA